MTGDPWHCVQVPNGENPLVVCQREQLATENQLLRSILAKLAADGAHLDVQRYGPTAGVPVLVVPFHAMAEEAWETDLTEDEAAVFEAVAADPRAAGL